MGKQRQDPWIIYTQPFILDVPAGSPKLWEGHSPYPFSPLLKLLTL
jgi:hypothetical protein